MDGLAPSTSTVNRRVEEMEADEEYGDLQISPKKDTRRQSIIAPELKDILSPEDTKKSFENVESVLQELKMSFNIGDRDEEEAGGSEEEMQKRAEERKKKEQEARRNREKARNTKDPRRRVAAMLEQGRDWGQARPDQVRDRKVKVPMQVYTSLHATGAERIEMVDVHTLQGRCKGLSAGSCNYREVRNLAEEEERQAKWLNATAPLEPKDFIRENKAQLGYYTDMHEESRYRAELFEAKLKLAKKRKERADEAKSEQKIAMMCGRRRFMKGPGLFNEVLSGYLRRISPNKEAPSGKQQEEEGKPARIWTAVRGSVMEAVEYKWKDRRRKVVQQAAAKRASFPELLRRKIAHRRRMRKLRAVMKGVCGFVAMRIWVQRKYNAQTMMVHLLNRIIEASAFREVVAKFNHIVKQIQRAARSFIRRKRAWCKKASKLWIHVEDKHLADFYSYSEKESRDDAVSRRSSGSRRASSRPERNSILRLEPSDDQAKPWQAMRIPKDHRMFTLGRFFIFKVKHRRLQLDVCQDMTSVEAAAQRDMEEIFGLPYDCDADEKRVGEEIGHLFEQKGIWLWAQISITKSYTVEVNEEELVNLIALSACELSRVPPFQDHPANAVFQVNQGKCSARFWRIIHRQVEYKDNPSSPGRKCWGQLCRKQVMKTTKAKKMDVDSVMKRFSPRFLQEAAAETEVEEEVYDSAVPLPLDEESDLDMYAAPGEDTLT